jgi:dephospho-CoA kinase
LDFGLQANGVVVMTIQNPKSKIQNRPVIGLVGQVCAGKSTVAAAFKKRGAEVYDADLAVRELYTRPETIEQVRKMFGDGVLDKSGQVNRRALGRIVFSDAAKLEQLTTQIVYPRTGEAIKGQIEAFRTSTAPALLLDAPTLFESGRDSVCDHIVYVTAPDERREKWAKERGWESGELQRRESKLMDDRTKRKRADAVIENKGGLDDVDRQVGELWKQWL